MANKTSDSESFALHARDANLDLLRAIAILMVLIHHLGVMWRGVPTYAKELLSLGMYGVDLFFVLSGWLIGGLFWREMDQFGNVSKFRFWLRRALRTMPPYFVALAVTWFAAYVGRGEPFDWRYLLFLQNYSPRIPFFLASWSLCVEEHFYVILPCLAAAVAGGKRAIVVTLAFMAVSSPIARYFDRSVLPSMPFGYSDTATHLHLTGISLGVICAYLATNHHANWSRIQQGARWLFGPMLVTWLTIPRWSVSSRFYLGNELSALLATCVIASVAGKHALPLARSRHIFQIALYSYSIYLTHGLVLHLCVMARPHLPPGLDFIQIPSFFLVALCIGAVYFYCVEQPAIRLRDELVPRRRRQAVSALTMPEVVETSIAAERFST